MEQVGASKGFPTAFFFGMLSAMTEQITKILSGQGLAIKKKLELKMKILQTRQQPGLAVILVGLDPASRMYVQFKTQASQEVGIYLETFELPEDVKEKKLLKIIAKLNKNKKIHGILVQLPLPDHIDTLKIMSAVAPEKDVDGFHPLNAGLLAMGAPRLMPATVKGIWSLIAHAHVELRGKNVVMVGASNIVGKPMAMQFINCGATVTICQKTTDDLASFTKHADIIVTATGVPKLITADMVKKGVVVIDAGISRVEGKVVGDVDYETVKEKASAITPVPGGVGPMTVVSLLENTWLAMRRVKGLEEY